MSFHSYRTFHPSGPNFLRSSTTEWKKHNPYNNFLNAIALLPWSAYETWSKALYYYSITSPKQRIMFALSPVGGSLVTLMLDCNTNIGKKSLGIDVNQSRNDGWIDNVDDDGDDDALCCDCSDTMCECDAAAAAAAGWDDDLRCIAWPRSMLSRLVYWACWRLATYSYSYGMKPFDKWQFWSNAHDPLSRHCAINFFALSPCPWPNDTYFNSLFSDCAKHCNASSGSAPCERTKIIGVLGVLSYSTPLRSNAGGYK